MMSEATAQVPLGSEGLEGAKRGDTETQEEFDHTASTEQEESVSHAQDNSRWKEITVTGDTEWDIHNIDLPGTETGLSHALSRPTEEEYWSHAFDQVEAFAVPSNPLRTRRSGYVPLAIALLLVLAVVIGGAIVRQLIRPPEAIRGGVKDATTHVTAPSGREVTFSPKAKVPTGKPTMEGKFPETKGFEVPQELQRDREEALGDLEDFLNALDD
ncbi:hypothetical protein cyc_06117 [Cyclospora cayetanensis]|uniref:Transmembrane protein n=1 Tax=Cyclospora cayetanensis TaxID=88456 RepID=A0A1D3D427_9EIME|nr:hypothetical protein cyc_06117 [Cyclospora cayetanensis]